jgi:hypothetical protein
MSVAKPDNLQNKEGTSKVNRSRCVTRTKVTTDGKNLVSHAGLALLGEVADRTGLTLGLSHALEGCGISWHTHDPGTVLTHLALAIADGGDCLSDIQALREQPEIFGYVASVTTAWRAMEAVACIELAGIDAALGAAREIAWAANSPGESLVIDFDATLVNSHSDKQDAAPNYKGGYGFHPLGAWCDNTSEPLAIALRPGNAGANDAHDHCNLLDRVLASLPSDFRAGHDLADDPADVVHPILIRADSAGASHDFARAITEANCDFSIGYPIDSRVRDALLITQEEAWVKAAEAGGKPRDGAEVVELTRRINLSAWPQGTRLIVRRERPHPGAQLSLFDTHEGFRHTAFITNSQGEIETLETRHRQHARVEDRIRAFKDTGGANLPFEDYVRNQAWLAVTQIAQTLISWSQMLCLEGDSRNIETKRFRYRFLHTAALLVKRARGFILRLDETWPWADELAKAFTQLRQAIP